MAPPRSPHLVALVSGFGWHVQDLLRAAPLVGIRLDPIAFPRLMGWVGGDEPTARIDAGEASLDRADGVLVRMMPPGSLEQVVFRMDALHLLEARGVPVLNPPRAVEAAVDKYLALGRLAAAGLPVPETWTGERASDALAAFDRLGGDVVVKPLFGAEGRGLVRVSDRELALRTFGTLERLQCVLYVQRYVRNDGHDLRVFVLAGAVLGAFRRHARAGDWRTNVAQGGRAEPCGIEPPVDALALRAADAVGARMAGVDLILDRDLGRWVVLEVNAVPGWRALSQVTGIDVAAAILAHLRDRRP